MHEDYKDLLSLFAKHRVRYLVVGAYAVIYYTEPRYTKDIDLWVENSPANAARVYRALAEFGAPVEEFSPEEFTERYMVFQFGIEPVRIDVLTTVTGVTFRTAWENRRTAKVEVSGRTSFPSGI